MIQSGIEVQQATNAPRASRNEGGVVVPEGGTDPSVGTAMEEMGHSTKAREPIGAHRPIWIEWERGILPRETAPSAMERRRLLARALGRDCRYAKEEWTWRIESATS